MVAVGVVVIVVVGVASVEGENKDSSFGGTGGGEEKEAPFGEGDDDIVDPSPVLFSSLFTASIELLRPRIKP